MGKALIIKGADFSENAVAKVGSWAFEYSDEQISSSSESIFSSAIIFYPSSANWSNFENKKVVSLKLYAKTNGTLDIISVDKTKNSNNTALLETVNVTEGLNIIELSGGGFDLGTNYMIGLRTGSQQLLYRHDDGWTFASSTNNQAYISPGFFIDFYLEGLL